MARRRARRTPDGRDAIADDGGAASRHAALAGHTPTPSGTAAFRALHRRIGNRAVARLVGASGTPDSQAQYTADDRQLQPRRLLPSGVPSRDGRDDAMRQLRVGRAAQGDHAVQRVIKLDGTVPDTAALYDRAKDLHELIVLLSWDWSDTVHDFVTSGSGRRTVTADQKLANAVKAAKSAVQTVPPLYSAANLTFLTKASGRLPTMYFVSGSLSGRIRQQHGSGPAVISQSGKVDYFFSNQDDLYRFQGAARQARAKGEDFTDDVTTYGGSLTATTGNFHLEITFSGKKPGKTHPSGGTIDVDRTGYDDTKIKTIYQQAIGITI